MPVRRLLIVLLACAGLVWAGPDDDFVEIYQLVQVSDAHRAAGRNEEARAGYEQARVQLLQLKKDHPTWNERVIAYRIRYVDEKLSLLPDPAPAVAAPVVRPPALPVGQPAAPEPAPEGEVLTQLRGLHQEIGQLRSEKERLEARLREALTAQPAPVDPRELQAAAERITRLQATNQFLAERLEVQQAERQNLVDRVLVEEAERALAAANAQLAAQAEKTTDLERLRHSAEAELQRLRSGEIRTLESENSTLKSQVKELSAATPRGDQIANLAERVSRLQDGLAAVRRENETLLADRVRLEADLEALRQRQTEEGLVRVRQLETDLAFARAEGERQGVRALQLEQRLLREQQARGLVETDNRFLSNRVAELTVRVEDLQSVRIQLAAEREEREEIEAQLKAAEARLGALRPVIPGGVQGDTEAAFLEILAAEPAFAAHVMTIETESARLRDALRESRARQNELLMVLAEAEKARSRWERERLELMATIASLQTAPTAKQAAATRRAIESLEERLRRVERERDALARRLENATQTSRRELQATNRTRVGSPRDEASRSRLQRR
ncbi:MAG: hypothetical protein KF791_20695 [Verrucomicrobiae bacterium]|nr:hypothetical protein [Verrucomicrobiae bacterium]